MPAYSFLSVHPKHFSVFLQLFGLVLFKRKVIDQGVGPAWQRQSGAGAGEGFLVLFKIIEQYQELALK